MGDERARCAAESVGRGEPLWATASRVRRWLVVEQPGPWGRDALLQSRLDAEVARSLESMSRRHGVRTVLARRPGWERSDHTVRRVHLAHSRPDGGWIEELDCDEEQLMNLDLGALRSRARPGIGRNGPGSLVLVCTNGRHDPCCADLGRPVVRALAAAGTPDVWECSHIGGDRFAANVVSLPTGVYLGRVPPERASAIVADLTRGLIALEHYRGRSCYPAFVQAAEMAARRHLDERRIDGLALVSSDRMRGGDELATRFRHRTGDIEVRIRRSRSHAAPATCMGGTAHPWAYEVLDVR